ncbi:MAG: efflux RND transporter permease subunit [Chthonomonadales bacterium]
MWLTKLAIARPVVIWMALAAVAILGVLAYLRLPADLNPQVDIPTVTVVTVYPGAGPREVEALVTKPLEDAVGSVSGVKDVFSSSQEAVSIISMDLVVGTDMDRAVAAIREKVDAARALLPDGAQTPVVARLDINAQPVLYLAVTADRPLSELWNTVNDVLKPRLARVVGVASVTVLGGERQEVRVDVSARRLEEYGVTLEDVVNAVKAGSQNVPGGSVEQGRRQIGVRTLAAFTRLEEIRQAQILSPALMMASPPLFPGMVPGSLKPALPAPVTIGDVARVYEAPQRPRTLTRANGRPSIGIVITKTADANTVSVVDGVKRMLAQLRPTLPPDVRFITSRDDAGVVRDALNDVDATLVLGAILAMLVVFVFLHNIRGTVIVALALPACMVATFLAMYFAHFTLNQMTLLALSLSVGILIDDSIVVLESITRHLGRGETPTEAAYNGRTEIGFASVTLTLSDVVVFLPIAFMGGIVGAFFRQFGLTVVAATLFSLVVSFTLTPSLASRWYRQGEDPEHPRGGIFFTFEAWYRRVTLGYQRLLHGALRHRTAVLAWATVLLIAAALVIAPSLGFEFLPATDQGQIVVTAELPPDASLEATDRIARKIEARLVGQPDVENYVTTVGQILGGFGAIPQQGPQYAQINVRLWNRAGLLERLLALGRTPPHTRTRTDAQVVEAIRSSLSGIAGARITVAPVRTVANVGPPVQIQLRGADLNDLTSAATQLRDRLRQMPGVFDADISVRPGRSELAVRVDRVKAAAMDLPPAEVGLMVRDALEGNAESVLREGGTEKPIRVELADIDRNDREDMVRLPVGVSQGRAVLLGQVSDFNMETAPTAIDRINGQRMVTVTANLAPGYALGTAQADIDARRADIPMPGIEVHWGGETEAMQENAGYFAMALGLAVVLVYLVMASLFNSLLNPFVIMFTLPMALVGGLGALALTGSTLSLVAMIGIIMLVGLMGRNAILLIDYTGTLRARGMARNEAVAEAGATRLRPILMTTLATMLGMLPVALRIGRASELRAPMAIVVIGGLLLSTLLTLVVVPLLYTLFDDLRERLIRRV